MDPWSWGLLIFLLYFCLFALHRLYHHPYIFYLCGDWRVVCECCESISVWCECMFVFVFCPLFCMFFGGGVDNSLFLFWGGGRETKTNPCLGWINGSSSCHIVTQLYFVLGDSSFWKTVHVYHAFPIMEVHLRYCFSLYCLVCYWAQMCLVI